MKEKEKKPEPSNQPSVHCEDESRARNSNAPSGELRITKIYTIIKRAQTVKKLIIYSKIRIEQKCIKEYQYVIRIK